MKEEGECICANNKVREYFTEKKTFEQRKKEKKMQQYRYGYFKRPS